VFVQAQQVVATNTNLAVPPLVNFSGTLTDTSGKPIINTAAVTFSLYSDQTGGAALWMETQIIQPDHTGHYTVTLGSTTGLPAEIFTAGQAHWLGVRIEAEAEQPRVLLVSVPYAMKAGIRRRQFDSG
jgi:trimeric autotransporter adhesin